MSDILNFNVSDEIVNNIVKNNSALINIKNSVGICTIRCGQNIEDCSDVILSTMTNYGKILVINPKKDNNEKATCSIQLPFDNNNDNTDTNGTSSYTFKKIFFTVPSLHRLNDQIYDMESFIVFSSTQKNGNILYIVLCTLYSGTTSVPVGDRKLVNYTLINNLFRNNTIPEIGGTNPINSGPPNPVELSDFIPPNGSRSFYGYTHPSNIIVNLRIFQETMFVSNDVLSNLKGKLTPNNTYTDFKTAISKIINPFEGLFITYSPDKKNNYESFKQNKIIENNEDNDNTDNYNDSDNDSDNDIKRHKEKDKDIDSEDDKKKFKRKINVNEEESTLIDKNNSDFEVDDNKDTFESEQKYINKDMAIFLIVIIGFLLVTNFFSTYIINNIFAPSNGISEANLPNCLSELSNKNISQLINIKFKFYSNIFLQVIFSLILLIFILARINNLNNNRSQSTIVFLLVLILFITFRTCKLNISYLLCNIKGVYDENFAQKKEFLYNYVKDKIYEGNPKQVMKKVFKYMYSTNYSDLLRYSDDNCDEPNIMSGGSPNNGNVKSIVRRIGIDNTNDNIKGKINKSKTENKIEAAPGSNDLENQDLKLLRQKSELSNINSFSDLFKLFSQDIIKQRFMENPKWITGINFYLVFTFLFFIFGNIINLRFISKSEMKGFNFLISLIISFSAYLPLIICFILIALIIVKFKLGYIIIAISIAIFLLSIFGLPFVKYSNSITFNDNLKGNGVFWSIISCILMNILLIIGSLIFKFHLKIKGISINGSDEDKANEIESAFSKYKSENVLKLVDKILLLKQELENEKMKSLLATQEVKNLRNSMV